MNPPGMLAAFGAGLLSFVSPCVLPLIPGYLSYMSGLSVDEVRRGGNKTRILVRILAFVGGFSAAFTVLGVVFSGGALFMGASGQVQSVIPVVSGVIIALFGLSMIFDFARFLNREFRFHAREGRGRSFRDSGPGAFLLGLTFAAGWSPCIGPILASILLFAGKDGNILRSVVLLLMYSAGLGLPFVLSALFFDRLAPVMQFLKRNGTMVRRASGVLLALFGLAMAFGSLSWFSGLAVGTGYQLQSIRETRPLLTSVATLILLMLPVVAGVGRMLRSRRQGKRIHPFSLGVVLFFSMVAILEIVGVVSMVSVLSSWLVFTGA